MTRVESDSEYYYDILNINDRLHDMIIAKHKSIYNAYKLLGNKGHNLYEFVSSLEMLKNICSKLDIDFGYCLTGKSYFNDYDLQKLVKVYESCRYKKRKPNGTSAIISMIRHGKKNIKIASLLRISTLLKKNIADLI